MHFALHLTRGTPNPLLCAPGVLHLVSLDLVVLSLVPWFDSNLLVRLDVGDRRCRFYSPRDSAPGGARPRGYRAVFDLQFADMRIFFAKSSLIHWDIRKTDKRDFWYALVV